MYDGGHHYAHTQTDDPGFARSLQAGSPLGRLRLMAVYFCLPPVFLTLVAFFVVPPAEELNPLALFFPGVGVVSAALAALWPVRPLPAGMSPDEAQSVAANRVSAVILLRLALCEAAFLFGFVSAFAFMGGMLPVFTGLLITAVSLPLVAMPTRSVLHRIQDRLEAHGTTSRMWEGLNRSGPVGQGQP